MATVRVTRRATFNAAHRLHNPQKSDAWNKATFGKCNNPAGHGHNYELEVTVEGEPDADTGYVIDLGDLRSIVQEQVIDQVDHTNLNVDVPFMAGVLPSTENFAIAIWNRIAPKINGGRLVSVRLRETENNSVEYCGE